MINPLIVISSEVMIIILLIFELLFSFIVAAIIACYQVTGTLHLLDYYGDCEFFCFSMVNYQYRKAKRDGMSTGAFIRKFYHNYLDSNKLFLRRISEKDHKLLVKILASPSFIESNYGARKYSSQCHQGILNNWFELIADDYIQPSILTDEKYDIFFRKHQIVPSNMEPFLIDADALNRVVLKIRGFFANSVDAKRFGYIYYGMRFSGRFFPMDVDVFQKMIQSTYIGDSPQGKETSMFRQSTAAVNKSIKDVKDSKSQNYKPEWRSQDDYDMCVQIANVINACYIDLSK